MVVIGFKIAYNTINLENNGSMNYLHISDILSRNRINTGIKIRTGGSMVTVQVLWKNSGTPAVKQKVACSFGRRWGDNKTTDVTTNDLGEAYFEVDQKSGEIYVNGLTMYKGMIAGKVIVYLDN